MFGWTRPAFSRQGSQDGRDKILISGTGRAGTTMLVQLFTALGFNTGYDLETATSDIDPISKAGLERLDAGPNSPYVIKSPIYADLLLPLLADQTIRLRAVILPMRDLTAAAQSRIRVTQEALAAGATEETEHPGGMWLTRTPAQQEAKLAIQFYKIMQILTAFGITPITMDFPRLARNEAYLHDQLEPLLRQHGVSRLEFRDAFARVVQPDRIHDFAPTQHAAAE